MTSPAQKAAGEIHADHADRIRHDCRRGTCDEYKARLASIIQQAITEAVDAAVAQERERYTEILATWKQRVKENGITEYAAGVNQCANEFESLGKEK